MARDFDGSTQDLRVDSAPVTAAPLTMACWFRSDSTTVSQTLIWLGDKDATNQFWRLIAAGSVAGDPIRFTSQATSAANADTSTGYSASTWHHACGVEASATDRRVYIDGGSEGTNTTSRSPAGADRVGLGATLGSSLQAWFDGRIAEAAIWNVALTAAEVAILARRVSPLMVRPESLVAYWPVGFGSPDPDFGGSGFALTLTAAPALADHAPVAPQFSWNTNNVPYQVAAGGDLSISKSETVTLSESTTVAPVTGTNISKSEAVTIGEAVTMYMGIDISQSETITIAEALTVAPVYDTNISLSETVTVTDTPTVAMAGGVVDLSLSLDETITVSESVTISNPLDYISVSDGITVAEAVSLAVAELNISNSETVTVSESVSLYMGIDISQTETVTLSEALTIRHQLDIAIGLSETVTVTDTATLDGLAIIAFAGLGRNRLAIIYRDKTTAAKYREKRLGVVFRHKGD